MAKFDYDVLVVGGGAAGLVSSGICASFGAKTALIEKNKLGGDCTWSGCVPSKALLHIAKQVAAIEKSKSLGITVGDVAIDFAQVMRSVRDMRQHIYEDADSPDIMQSRGVTVLTGAAHFSGDHEIVLEHGDSSRVISFRSAIIAAGGSPMVIPIPGLADIDFLTNENIFELTEQPEHLVILGSGPIGIEMAQAFDLLGTKVTVVALDERILIRDEPKCAELIHGRLSEAGVEFHLGQTVHSVQKKQGRLELPVGPLSGADKTLHCDALLVAVGRVPNLSSLNLEAAGVAFKKNGIPVDNSCRTSVKHIFAAGDITTFLKFTHVAENMAKTAALNATFRLPLFRYEQRVIPWVTYTSPECGHVGLTAEELSSKSIKFETIELPYSKIDRAVTEHEEEGWVVLHTTSSGKILGAHAVGAQAGEIITEYALAMKNGLKVTKIADTVHAYPTMLLGARRAADQFYVRMQKRWLSNLIRRLFRYQGAIPDYVGSKTVL